MRFTARTAMLLIALAISLSGCGRIETGEVGVRTSAISGKVSLDEEAQGFYTAFTSSVDVYTTKEITVPLTDLRPKAKDNLSLQDMDVDLLYQVDPDAVADQSVKYANASVRDPETRQRYAGYRLVKALAEEAIFNAVADYDSLTVHQNREKLMAAIRDYTAKRLDASDPGVYKVTRVVIRNLRTDPSVEQSIRNAVGKTKELEAREKEVEISRQQALAYDELNESLTENVLRKLELDVKELAIREGSKPIIIFGSGQSVTPFYDISK